MRFIVIEIAAAHKELNDWFVSKKRTIGASQTWQRLNVAFFGDVANVS
jgi:hypothetical protein